MARRWWHELVADNFDRINGWVRIQSRDHLSVPEQEDALQRALIKLLNNMILTFKGTSMGEWVNATKTLVFGACMDTMRREATHSKHRSSLAAMDDEGQETVHPGVLEELQKQLDEQDADEREAEAMAQRGAFLDWALPQLAPKRRAVIELDRQGVPVEEIQRRLGVSRDVVYQTRRRALLDIEKLRREWSP